MIIMLYAITLILIGITQVTGALIRVAFAKRQDSVYAIKLKQYLLFVVAYFAIAYLFSYIDAAGFFIFGYLLILPPFIAMWYWNHVDKWAKKHKRIKEFDNELMLEVPCKERLELERLPKRTVNIIKMKSGLKVQAAL